MSIKCSFFYDRLRAALPPPTVLIATRFVCSLEISTVNTNTSAQTEATCELFGPSKHHVDSNENIDCVQIRWNPFSQFLFFLICRCLISHPESTDLFPYSISAPLHTLFPFTLCCVLCTTKNKRRMERSCSASFSIYVSFGFVFAPSSWNLLNVGFLFWITIESKIDVLPMKKMKRKKVGQTLYGEREWALRYETNEANSIPTKLLWRIRFVSTTLLGSSFVSAAAAAAAFCIDTISNNSLFIIFDFVATRPCSFHLHKHKIDEVLASARKKTNKLRWNKLLMKPFFWFFFNSLEAKLIKYFVIDRSNACLNWGHPRKFALLLTSEMNLNRAKTTIFTHFAFALKARAAWNYSRNSL